MSVVNKKADDEAAVLAKIAAMPERYRAMGDLLFTLPHRPGSWVIGATWSQDGTQVLTWSDVDTAQVWVVPATP